MITDESSKCTLPVAVCAPATSTHNASLSVQDASSSAPDASFSMRDASRSSTCDASLSICDASSSTRDALLSAHDASSSACDTSPSASLVPGEDAGRKGPILNDVERRQLLLAKLMRNEQGTARLNPAVAAPTEDTPEASTGPPAGDEALSLAPPPHHLTLVTRYRRKSECLSACRFVYNEDQQAPRQQDINDRAVLLPNLAAAIFVKAHRNASAQDFAAHLDSLTPEELLMNETRHRFALAHTAKAPKATVDEVVDAFETATEEDIKIYREAVVLHAGKAKKPRASASKGKKKAV
ncbi:hypothetical protein BN946_scf184541.g4 [Trametes cinnabarina]|uniref:Uncharacterized protein n=1 Tax=Pycnoporus cinnabarinus TaxID=5643 RepID=A0A060T004_PYCCI|nr:hypothetical protein BN946_scf184541.g4 [Trametes cinnabarina]